MIAGILPLRSAEHAEYLHHEVPGIRIPDKVRSRLAASRDPSADGLEIARELLHRLPGLAAGVHIMPPYRKPDRVLQVIEALQLDAVRGVTLDLAG